MTAIYMMGIVVRAYFPKQDFDYETISEACDPNWMMLLPLGVFVMGILALGLHPVPLLEFFRNIAMGLL